MKTKLLGYCEITNEWLEIIPEHFHKTVQQIIVDKGLSIHSQSIEHIMLNIGHDYTFVTFEQLYNYIDLLKTDAFGGKK